MLYLPFNNLTGQQAVNVDEATQSRCYGYNEFRLNSNIKSDKMIDQVYPRGGITFNQEHTGEIVSLDDIHDLLNVESGSTFELTRQTTSRFNPEKTFYRFQQFHQGVPVDGGGYTLAASNIPGDGCVHSVYSLSPSIITGLQSTNTVASISSQNIESIINANEVKEVDLVIVKEIDGDCTPRLVYKTDYLKEGKKQSWIDAITGDVLKTFDMNQHLMAPTQDYGDVFLDDTPYFNGTENGRRLVSSGNRVWTYNNINLFSHEIISGIDDDGAYDEEQIPFTIYSTWPQPGQQVSGEGVPNLFQMHHVGTESLNAWDDYFQSDNEEEWQGFQELHISTTTAFGSGAQYVGHLVNPVEELYVFIGALEDGRRLNLFDVLNHEMTHGYLDRNNLLNYNSPDTRAVNEGIADIFGVYFEAMANQDGVHDWLMADDRTNGDPSDRDVVNPAFDCITADGFEDGSKHERGSPLTHWFYLITDGRAGTNSNNPTIEGLGLEKAMSIVVETLNNLESPDVGYEGIKEASLMVIDDTYGICSVESTSVRRAWNAICVGEEDVCPFRIGGKSASYCQGDKVRLCVYGGLDGQVFNWNYPPDWNAVDLPAECMLFEVPEFDSYPQYVTINVYGPATGESAQTRLFFRDCTGTAPVSGCDQAYLYSSDNNDSIDGLDIKHERATVQVYSIGGVLLYDGKVSELQFDLLDYKGVLITAYFDGQGKFIESKKVIHIQ